MFTPDFGMFIAPGCDGMRGAVTLGYVALIVGYLKRVSMLRWSLYVIGAVLLGHLFNLIRLCALVLYYRIAAGHPALEQVAKEADYLIGGCLFLVAAVLFLWIALRKEENENLKVNSPALRATAKASAGTHRLIYWKVAVFAIIALLAGVPGMRAIRNQTKSLVASMRSGELTLEELDDRLPKQLGDYSLIRAWHEQSDGDTVMENAAYAAPGSSEITVGIWLRPAEHIVHWSRMVHGNSPEMRADRSFATAQGRPVSFDTAFYSDGITDSLEGNTFCNPRVCQLSGEFGAGVHLSFKHLGFKNLMDFNTRGERFVPIFFRVERPHADEPQDDTHDKLSAESLRFLSNVDFTELSRRFQ
jgi:exosortase J